MDKKLIKFIDNHVERGIHLNRQKQHLIDSGYDSGIVEKHIEHALKSYIKKRLSLGHEIEEIKHFLSDIGYEMAIIEKHLNHAIKFNKNKKYSLLTILTLIVIIILLIGLYQSSNLFNSNQKTGIAILSNVSDKTIDVSDESIEDKTNESSDNSLVSKELLNKALITHDAALCNEIDDNALNILCRQVLEGTK